MNEETFDELLARVRPYITKQTTQLRRPVPPEQKLAITLRYLATGNEGSLGKIDTTTGYSSKNGRGTWR